MKHTIYGFLGDEDFPTFEKELSLTLKDLKPIMGWVQDGECVNDFRLTPQQIKDIEALAGTTFPAELRIFLTCSA